MKRTRILVSVLTFLVFGFLVGCAANMLPVLSATQADAVKSGGEVAILAPLPKNIKIIPPAADVPKNIAAFSGIWEGLWNEDLPTILVVEEITPPDVRGIIAVGKTQKTAGVWMYFEGKVATAGRLEFQLRNAQLKTISQIVYIIASDEELFGTFRVFSSDMTAVLSVMRVTMRRKLI